MRGAEAPLQLSRELGWLSYAEDVWVAEVLIQVPAQGGFTLEFCGASLGLLQSSRFRDDVFGY